MSLLNMVLENDSEKLRLNKFLAGRVGISRRQADILIEKGKVLVNERPAQLGQSIDKNDKVCYNGRIIPFTTAYTCLALNKPAGYVSSRRQQGSNPTLYSLLPKNYQQLKTVGRLDRDTSGLILLTNDGDFAFQMTHPQFHKEKSYYLQLDHPLAPLHQQMVADFGVELPDGHSRLSLTKPENAEFIEALVESDESALEKTRELYRSEPRLFWRVTMHEGRNRQIRRTFGALGYTVVRLHRTQFGPYRIDGLAPGEFVEVGRRLR